MKSAASVHQFLCVQDHTKRFQAILTKPCRIMQYCYEKNPLNFGAHLTQNGRLPTASHGDFHSNIMHTNRMQYESDTVQMSTNINDTKLQVPVGLDRSLHCTGSFLVYYWTHSTLSLLTQQQEEQQASDKSHSSYLQRKDPDQQAVSIEFGLSKSEPVAKPRGLSLQQRSLSLTGLQTSKFQVSKGKTNCDHPLDTVLKTAPCICRLLNLEY